MHAVARTAAAAAGRRRVYSGVTNGVKWFSARDRVVDDQGMNSSKLWSVHWAVIALGTGGGWGTQERASSSCLVRGTFQGAQTCVL